VYEAHRLDSRSVPGPPTVVRAWAASELKRRRWRTAAPTPTAVSVPGWG